MKDNAIILDLDDTLISTHFRQYRCMHDYLSHVGIRFIDFDVYLELRRLHSFSNTKLLESLHIALDWEDFRFFYLTNIESEKYLALDKLIVDKQLLTVIQQKNFKLILLSLRGNHQNSKRQLQDLGIDTCFTAIYFEHHHPDTNPKLSRLKQLITEYNVIAFCGDTVSDYEAAELLNINFVQVKTSLYDLHDFAHATHFNNINQYLLSIP